MKKSIGLNHFINHYFSFSSKVRRIPYLFYSLGSLSLSIISLFFALALATRALDMSEYDFYTTEDFLPYILGCIFFSLIAIIFIIIFISFTIRRLNDVLLYKEFSWLLLIPIINMLLLLVLYTLPSINPEIKENEIP